MPEKVMFTFRAPDGGVDRTFFRTAGGAAPRIARGCATRRDALRRARSADRVGDGQWKGGTSAHPQVAIGAHADGSVRIQRTHAAR